MNNTEFIKEVAEYLKKNIKGLYITGSIRRKENVINDIDFITKRNLNDILEEIRFLPLLNDDKFLVLSFGEKYLSVKIECLCRHKVSITVDIWRAFDDYEYKFLKWMRNIDKGRNIYLRKKAKEKGYRLSDRGLMIDKNILLEFDTFDKLKKFITT